MVVILVPKFQPSIHKSVKQFGYSFAFDALPDKIRASPSPVAVSTKVKRGEGGYRGQMKVMRMKYCVWAFLFTC